jgi:hypothetical protein
MAWKQDLGGWTTAQDERRRQRETEARQRQSDLHRVRTSPDGLIQSGLPSARGDRHVSFGEQGAHAAGGAPTETDGFLPAAFRQRAAGAFAAPAMASRRYAPEGLTDDGAAEPDAVAMPSVASTLLGGSVPRASLSPERAAAAAPVWVAVRGVDPLDTGRAIAEIAAAFGPVVGHRWLHAGASAELQVRFQSPHDARHAVLTNKLRSAAIDATLLLRWVRDTEAGAAVTVPRTLTYYRKPGSQAGHVFGVDPNGTSLWWWARHTHFGRWTVVVFLLAIIATYVVPALFVSLLS